MPGPGSLSHHPLLTGGTGWGPQQKQRSWDAGDTQLQDVGIASQGLKNLFAAPLSPTVLLTWDQPEQYGTSEPDIDVQHGLRSIVFIPSETLALWIFQILCKIQFAAHGYSFIRINRTNLK